MDWKYLLAYITGTVDQELLLRNEYLVTGNWNPRPRASRYAGGANPPPDGRHQSQVARAVLVDEGDLPSSGSAPAIGLPRMIVWSRRSVAGRQKRLGRRPPARGRGQVRLSPSSAIPRCAR